MRTLNQPNIWLLAVALSVTALACGGDDGENAPPDTGTGGGGFFDDAGDEEDSGGDNGDAGVDSGEVEEDDAGGGDNDATVDPACEENPRATKAEADKNKWAENCFKCEPTENEEFLNSCATGWVRFDESNYPSSWTKKGPLPQLP